MARILKSVGSDSKLAFALAKELGLFKVPTTQAIDPKQAYTRLFWSVGKRRHNWIGAMPERTLARKNRRLLEVDLEQELSLEIEKAGKEGVVQTAINDKTS